MQDRRKQSGVSAVQACKVGRVLLAPRFVVSTLFTWCAIFTAPLLLHGQPAPLFEDVSEQSGIAVDHVALNSYGGMGIGTGAAWFDFDRDDDLDLYVTQGVGSNRLYRNNGDGTFSDIAVAFGATDSTHSGSGVAIADYDNDGWPDIFLANADQDVLLRNHGGLFFEDVTATVGLSDGLSDRGMSASWGDFNRDGYLDLYVANHFNISEQSDTHQDRLYLNNQGASFTDVSHLLGMEHLEGYSFIGSWTDFDEDGDLDLFLISDCGFNHTYLPSRLFRNDGPQSDDAWGFEEISEEVGADHCHNGMGIAVGDMDRDGHQEYFYTNIGERTLLLHYENDRFQDTAEAAGVYANHPDARSLWSWGANLFDYDLDGWLDLYVTAGTLSLRTRPEVDPQPNLLFHNQGDGTFEDVTDISGVDDPGRSRTSIYGDYDNDGDPDLFLINSNQQGRLFKNTHATENHYLIVDLEGTVSNRDGIGSQLTITLPDGSKQYWETRSGSSLGGGDDRAAYFGLGSFDRIASLEIQWPSGSRQSLLDLPANQRIRVTEANSASTNSTDIMPAPIIRINAYPNPFRHQLTLDVTTHLSSQPSLEITDLLGRHVYTTMLTTSQRHVLTWNGLNQAGQRVAPGIYFIQLLEDGHPVHHQAVVSF